MSEREGGEGGRGRALGIHSFVWRLFDLSGSNIKSELVCHPSPLLLTCAAVHFSRLYQTLLHILRNQVFHFLLAFGLFLFFLWCFLSFCLFLIQIVNKYIFRLLLGSQLICYRQFFPRTFLKKFSSEMSLYAPHFLQWSPFLCISFLFFRNAGVIYNVSLWIA